MRLQAQIVCTPTAEPLQHQQIAGVHAAETPCVSHTLVAPVFVEMCACIRPRNLNRLMCALLFLLQPANNHTITLTHKRTHTFKCATSARARPSARFAFSDSATACAASTAASPALRALARRANDSSRVRMRRLFSSRAARTCKQQCAVSKSVCDCVALRSLQPRSD